MAHPIIGWQSLHPVPNPHHFNDYLNARNGRLYFEDLDLAQLVMGGRNDQGLGRALGSPLEIVYLPRIRAQVEKLRQTFADAIRTMHYTGQFHYAYTSKANAAEEVVRTAVGTGAHYEITSWLDIDIVRLMKAQGHLGPEQMIICNGFKPAGSRYAEAILDLARQHPNVIPIIEDLSELPPLIQFGQPLRVGLRHKTYGPHHSLAEMEATNSRFGMTLADVERAAEIMATNPHLQLAVYHAMMGSQIADPDDFLARLTPAVEVYARLHQRFPSLNIFNFGGGMPVAMTLDFNFDYTAFARRLLILLQEGCQRLGVPAPDVMGEFGRYTVSEHGAHVFKVVSAKSNGSNFPWYIIDGSIMSSMPDTWALSEHFIVLPLTHLDQPFQRVQLGGITCDSDDVYPPKPSSSPLYLPVVTDDLYIGFFSIGAYQEMLGGVGGSKHCVIPEANELIIDRDRTGRFVFQPVAGQSPQQVLSNLGYKTA